MSRGTEIKTCQNCKKDFTIEPDDFSFYEKIKVPAPTFCFLCRVQRRMAYCNERMLYKRACNAPDHTEQIISVFSPDNPQNVYDHTAWWGNEWDGISYGREVDFSMPFFEQLKELWQKVSDVALLNINPVNSEYCSITEGNKNCYFVFGGDFNENTLYSTYIFNSKECMDTYWVTKSEFNYETVDCISCTRLQYSCYCEECYNSVFLFNYRNCHDCFGCVNLKNGAYCIFNKQYAKEEYEEFVPRIIEHMDKMPYVDKGGHVYKFGEFFPAQISPFAYNETIAQEMFPLSRDEALAQGFSWREQQKRNYVPTKRASELPDLIAEVSDSICNEIIECDHKGKCSDQCTTAFKITPVELQFYKQMQIPLPRLCQNCRHFARVRQRNPIQLWERKCMCAGVTSESGTYENSAKHFYGDGHCQNEFETSYAPERPEIVYCEQCYNQEIA